MEPLGGAAALLLGVVLLAAATGKLQDPRAFRAAVAELVPRGARVVATAVLAAELVIGAALTLAVAPRLAAAAALVLIGLFSVALLRLRERGGDVDCGCFGEPAGESGGALQGVARNALLAAVAVAILAVPPAEPLWSQPPQIALGEGTVAVGAACLWTLFRAVRPVKFTKVLNKS